MNGGSDYDEEYAKRLKQYLEKATDLKQSDLANYVAHRRVVIDLLNFAITQEIDGKFVREDVIHGLIMPMQVTSSRLPLLTIRVYNSGLEGVLGSGGSDAEEIHGGVSSG